MSDGNRKVLSDGKKKEKFDILPHKNREKKFSFVTRGEVFDIKSDELASILVIKKKYYASVLE